jgi:hypothetical protein
VYIEIRWSGSCGTNWARVSSGIAFLIDEDWTSPGTRVAWGAQHSAMLYAPTTNVCAGWSGDWSLPQWIDWVCQ